MPPKWSTFFLKSVSSGEIKRWRQEPTLFLGHGSDNRCHIGRQKNVLCKVKCSLVCYFCLYIFLYMWLSCLCFIFFLIFLLLFVCFVVFRVSWNILVPQLIQSYGSKRLHLVQITRSTPKMKKKARGMFALVEGDCEWVIFSGRNYKVLSFLSSDVQDLILVQRNNRVQ